jgi:hypothetical protein
MLDISSNRFVMLPSVEWGGPNVMSGKSFDSAIGGRLEFYPRHKSALCLAYSSWPFLSQGCSLPGRMSNPNVGTGVQNITIHI